MKTSTKLLSEKSGARSILRKFESKSIFTENEAWMLFRLAAFGEAIGWTLLIFGIGWQKFAAGHSGIPVLLAGKIHGMLFLMYMLAAAGLYPALNWPRPKAFVALLASIPPYGSLIFERWSSFDRSNKAFKTFYCCIAMANIKS
jgi:integral membrane protein